MRSGPRYTAETNPTPDPNVRMTWRTDAIRPRMGPEPDCQPRVVAMRMRTGGTGMERVSQAALIATGVGVGAGVGVGPGVGVGLGAGTFNFELNSSM